jgi:membrane protein DedA with SNARE-associated domain
MGFDSVISSLLDFVREQQAWAPVVVFVLALLESIVGLSLIVPSTAIFVGVGALIGASDLSFWPIFAGVALGGFIGDWISYVLGLHLKDRVMTWKSVRKRAHLIERTQHFLDKWGIAAVFIGRFISPIRSFVPFVAGMFRMPQIKFQFANAVSAVVWAYVLLAPGAALVRKWVG